MDNTLINQEQKDEKPMDQALTSFTDNETEKPTEPTQSALDD